MTRWNLTALLTFIVIVTVPGHDMSAAPEGPSFAGTWTLNRALCQFPKEVGFGMDVVPAGRATAGDRTGVEGGDPTGLSRGNIPRPVTEEEVRNRQQLVSEVKNPPVRLTVVQTDTAITLTDERGRSRTFHPDGREETQPLDARPGATITKWEGAKLVVRYKVEPERELRYTFSRSANPPQLVVLVQFVERGGRDTVTLVYEPAKPGDALPPASAPAEPLPLLPSQRAVAARPAAADSPGAGTPPGQMVPAAPAASGGATLPAGSLRPGSELRGLSKLGVVVEEIGPAAQRCGLTQAAVESAVSKSLSDAGLKIVRNSDEDTYLYVSINATAMTTGFCFSRYDVILYTNTTATLSFGSAPALVQVELLRSGGLAGGGATDHAAAVMRSLTQYVDQFVARIRDANK